MKTRRIFKNPMVENTRTDNCFFVHDIMQRWVCLMTKKNKGRAEITSSVFGMLVYVIWREKNKIKFENGGMITDEVLKVIVIHIHIKSQTRAKWKITLQQLKAYP
ncbi:hypothetical protein H5410_061283 [Solanum commersonii]|uniref:Uncharacterized protein n=1 Tax=Solanum commersonii TaxID=4109 RepID=A0A9J5W7C0_SOLCO|nr:hypothetical protein H5410_061283 [Solanum commersonii]